MTTWKDINITIKKTANKKNNNTESMKLEKKQLYLLKAVFNNFNEILTQKQPSEVLCKKDALKIFTNFIWKHLCWSVFLLKLLMKDSNTGVFPWNLQSIQEQRLVKKVCERLLLLIALLKEKPKESRWS